MVELIWDGKYDKDGRRTAPLRVALPFQTVETVNESAQQRQYTLDLFASGRDPEWRNRLIWGDKKYVLPSLLPEFAGKVDLIYIDPPFATGADFSFQAQVGEETFEKEASIIEQKAYRDTWGRGLDGYLRWFHETSVILYELLSETGNFYLHIDSNLSHYLKAILDEVFGAANFQNEIIWQRTSSHNDSRRWATVHDVLLFYTKSSDSTWNDVFTEYNEEYIQAFYRYSDARGIYRLDHIIRSQTMGARPNLSYEFKGYIPEWGWRVTKDKLEKLDQENRLEWSSTGRPYLKRYKNEQKGVPINSVITDIKVIGAQAGERSGYPTQKPEAFLERIIESSSNLGDLVLDCFCGSGTTAAVAEKLGRRWITCDLGRFAIHTARKRLLAIEGVRPFVVQNLGKYERQVWQQAEFGANAASVLREYRRFMLDLYHAEPLEGYTWLHGRKAGRMVHVGTVDSPIVRADVTHIAAEFRRAIGTGATAPREAGIDILGWDFAFETNEVTTEEARSSGLNVRFIRIPREVLEKKAVEQGDIKFHELAALGVDVLVTGREVTIALTDFLMPPDDVPQDVLRAVKEWSAWIDYWAIDFNFRDDTFHNEWQSYRTRRDRGLLLRHTHRYEEPGTYTVVVKVIDILGNDTTKSIRVEVK